MDWIRFRNALAGTTMLLLVTTAFLGTTTIRAQDQTESTSEPEPVPTWVENFGSQLQTLVGSDNSNVRNQALQHITYFASFYEEKIDFSDAVPTLVDLYRNDDDADVRLHALMALYAIGDEEGMQQVRQSMHDQRWPPRLQLVTLSALVDYYGAEAFSMDREAAEYAKRIVKYYTPKGGVEIGPIEPMEVVEPQDSESP